MQPNYVPSLLLDGFLSPTESIQLMERALAEGFSRTGSHYPPSYRDNDRLVCYDEGLAQDLFARLAPHLPRERVEEDGIWELQSINPQFRLCRYRDGQRFRIHRDGVHHCEDGRRSILTFMVYLNDAEAFEGGETRFFAGRRETDPVLFRLSPKAGRLIVFDHRVWHDGAPVHSGTKVVLRSDLIYRRIAGPRRKEGHRGYVWKALRLPSGEVVTCGRDRTIRRWCAEGTHLLAWHAHPSSVTALAVSPAGTLYSGSRGGQVRAWHGNRLCAEGLVEGAVLDVVWWKDRLLTAGAEGAVRSWGEDLRPTVAWHGHVGWVWKLATVEDRVLSAGEDGTIRSWGPAGEETLLFANDCAMTAVATASSGFVTGDERGVVRVHEGGKVREVADHGQRVRDIRVNGRWIASAGEDDCVRVTTISGVPVACHAHADFATSVIFEEGVLKSSSYDGGVTSWPLPR